MEIDTGSSNTLIGEDTYSSLQVRPKLKPSSVKLKSYTGDVVPVLGEFRTSVAYKGQRHDRLKVIVIQGSKTNLLGRDWLNLIKLDWKEVHGIGNVSVEELKKKYSRVFEPGLGELRDVKLHLDIDRSVKPRFFRARSLAVRPSRTRSRSSCRRMSTQACWSQSQPAAGQLHWYLSLKKDGTVQGMCKLQTDGQSGGDT